MALDATVAGAAANSYLTVADADALAAVDLGRNAKAWLGASADEKERALQRATAEIDAHVRFTVVYSSTQRLLFPRAEDLSAAGAPILSPGLARATYLQAAYLLQNADLIDDSASRRARGMTSFSNPDGTGGTLSEDPGFGHLHPTAATLIDGLAGAATVGWIVTD